MNEKTLLNIEKCLKSLTMLISILSFLIVAAVVLLLMAISSRDGSHTYSRACVVPKMDLETGHVLTADDLAIRTVTFTNWHSTVFESSSAALLVGHTLDTPVKAGIPLTKAVLKLAGEWPEPYHGEHEN